MIEERYRTGEALIGDDLTGEALARWYREEAEGYYGLTENRAAEAGNLGGQFWSSLNDRHVFRHLRNRQFQTVLAFGTADGRDVLPVASRTMKFVAVEPDRRWWSGSIGGRPTEWIEPEMDGEMPIESGTIDLILCFGVLHHVAKVSNTLRAFHRVLKKGAAAYIREPTSSMGDWTKARPMATRNERGISPAWLCRAAKEVGLNCEAPVLCGFAPLMSAADRLHLGETGSAMAARLDGPLSLLFGWNARYWRPGLVDKFAPGTAYYHFTRP